MTEAGDTPGERGAVRLPLPEAENALTRRACLGRKGASPGKDVDTAQPPALNRSAFRGILSQLRRGATPRRLWRANGETAVWFIAWVAVVVFIIRFVAVGTKR